MNIEKNMLVNRDITDFLISISTIFCIDMFLCILLGSRSRWFQLHAFINTIVLFLILPDIYLFYTNPLSGYRVVESHICSYFIFSLHIYHFFISNKLSFYDYFHHILFIGFGVFPVIAFVKTNQVHLGYLPCSGLPGIIEYSTLSLVKHNKIKSLTQKKINSYIYSFIRCPMCVYGVTLNFIAYKKNILDIDGFFLTFYLNFLLYFNGTFFNLLTVENYAKNKVGVN